MASLSRSIWTPSVPLLVDEPSFAGRRRDKTVDGSAIGGSAGSDGNDRAIGEGDTCEADYGRVERCKVTTKPRADAVGVVGTECGYSTDDDGFNREDEGVACVNGIDELSADGLAYAHREMIDNLDRERCSCRQPDGLCLTKRGGRN